MKSIFSVILLATVFFVSSCKSTQIVETPKVDLRQIIKSSDVTLLDVRIPEEFAKNTAKNAINIPLAELQDKAETLKGKKVVVFCNRGMQADQAAEILKKNGIEVYDGTSNFNVQAILDGK